MRYLIPSLLLLAAAIPSKGNAAPAQELWAKACSSCHGKDGKGNTPAGKKIGAKDLTVSKTTRDEIERQIKHGKNDEKGVSKMPAFAGKLSEEEIKELIQYVIQFRK